MFGSTQTCLMSLIFSAFLASTDTNSILIKQQRPKPKTQNLLINSSLVCLLLSDEVLRFSGGSFLGCHSCRGIASRFETLLASTQNKNSVSVQILIIPQLIMSMRRDVKKILNNISATETGYSMALCSGLGAADE